MKRCSRRLSRKKQGSKNRKKAVLTISRLHRRIRNIRKDFLHKESTKLARTKSVIVIEDLDVKKMLGNKKMSRNISDAGWSEFRRLLEYKTKWYGSTLAIAPRYYPSSKRCSACREYVKELPLEIRKWQCTYCRVIHDRDTNASKNLVIWYTESSSGIYACGDTSGGVVQKNY